jgi:hypothetical protein
MSVRHLRVTNGAQVGAWIASELGGKVGTVEACVPSRFEQFVRVLHPARTHDGTPVSWAAVAEATGGTVHPLVQWHALVGSSDPDNFVGSKWHGSSPSRGDLSQDVFLSLTRLLCAFTDIPSSCFFGIWDGWLSDADPIISRQVSDRANADGPDPEVIEVPPVLSPEDLGLPRLSLPLGTGHDYLVLCGSLSAASQIRDPERMGGFSLTSPSLIWPTDRAWFLVSDIDFDSTLVGGSPDLINAIVANPELEAWHIEPGDSLAADADRINLVSRL